MRTVAYVMPTFWTRGSGKALRGDPVAQTLALYLMTAPASNMIGLYYQPITTILHDTGLTLEQFKAAMLKLGAIAKYDEESSLVWVPESAKYQIGESLKPGDRKRSAIMREVRSVGAHPFAREFMKRYGTAYGLEDANNASLSDGASTGAYENAATPDPLPSPSLPLPDQRASEPKPASPEASSGVHRSVEPTSLESALTMPVRERCEFVLRRPDMAQWIQPERWPEVVAFASAVGAALKFAPRLGTYGRDSGVRAAVELFAAGYTAQDLDRAAKAAPAAKYFQQKAKRDLSAFTPTVVRILLADGDDAKPANDRESNPYGTADDGWAV